MDSAQDPTSVSVIHRSLVPWVVPLCLTRESKCHLESGSKRFLHADERSTVQVLLTTHPAEAMAFV
jgi:hypothetical protein